MNALLPAERDALHAAGYHVMRQGTWDNHTRELAVLRNENRWLREEKEHHEKWLAGILEESRRLQDRFNRITSALAVSGVEWSVIAELLGDDTRVTPPRGVPMSDAESDVPAPDPDAFGAAGYLLRPPADKGEPHYRGDGPNGETTTCECEIGADHDL